MEKNKQVIVRVIIAILYAAINPVIFILYWDSNILAKIISMPFALTFYTFATLFALFIRAVFSGYDLGFSVFFALLFAFLAQFLLLIFLSLTIDSIIKEIKNKKQESWKLLLKH